MIVLDTIQKKSWIIHYDDDDDDDGGDGYDDNDDDDDDGDDGEYICEDKC